MPIIYYTDKKTNERYKVYEEREMIDKTVSKLLEHGAEDIRIKSFIRLANARIR